MKYVRILVIMLFISVNWVNAQDWNPEIFSGIPATAKTRVFMDNFDNDKYQWIKNSSPSTHRIVNGVFYFANEFEYSFTDGKPINFDSDKDFELETRIKFISGNVDDFSGLFLGELVFGDKYIFGFSSLGHVRIVKEEGLDNRILLPAKKNEAVKQTEENLLTIRKVGQTYYFFVNETLVHTMPFEKLPGKYIGFQVAANTMVQINFLRLWLLEKK